MGRDMKKFPKIDKLKDLSKGKSAVKNLVPSNPIEDTGISFSFRYFKQIENFGITGKNDVWMSGLLDQLRLLSEKNADELLSDVRLKESLRMHPLDLSEGKSALSLDDFASIPQRYRPSAIDCPIVQFQISKANGRVIGFFNHNHSVFYIVFLDPNHNAQLSKYNDYKVREIKPCLSEIDDLKVRIAKHVELESKLANDAEDFLYSDNLSYLCLDSDLIEPLYRLVEKGEFKSRLEDFLLSEL